MSDTSTNETAARLRTVYACANADAVCKVYGVRKWDDGAWNRERDERALAKAYLAEHPADDAEPTTVERMRREQPWKEHFHAFCFDANDRYGRMIRVWPTDGRVEFYGTELIRSGATMGDVRRIAVALGVKS